MYLIRLLAFERLPVHQCFVGLICPVKVFKDLVLQGILQPGAEGLNGSWSGREGWREVLPLATPSTGTTIPSLLGSLLTAMDGKGFACLKRRENKKLE